MSAVVELYPGAAVLGTPQLFCRRVQLDVTMEQGLRLSNQHLVHSPVVSDRTGETVEFPSEGHVVWVQSMESPSGRYLSIEIAFQVWEYVDATGRVVAVKAARWDEQGARG